MAALALLAGMAGAQTPDTVRRSLGATISGVVHDSLARAPLPGAMVQLVSADSAAHSGRTAIADSLGRFAISGVPDGHYMLGFFHPMLDSLGMEPPLRDVVVAGQQPVTADLAIPSPSRLRAAICGPVAPSAPGAAIVGVVRDARDNATIAGATVTGEWLELSFTSAGVVHRRPRLTATTTESGWFAICNVPNPGNVALVASRGMDSTDRIEVQVPAEGFLRRELYVGPARAVRRLSGIVVTSADWTPLAGARVSISDGPRTVANARGEWTLVDAPAGTRMLQVLAVGYYPERRRVDVVSGAPPVRVELSTVRAVLDTIKVTAIRMSAPNLEGFRKRQRTTAGRFITPEDIARRQPLATGDLFRTMQDLSLDERAVGPKTILMRGGIGWCAPGVYVDDHFMRDLTLDDINAIVQPREVGGIEIYTEASAPPQFQRMDGCGSIVIWTK
ncbi:MAG TPA: carboxypeptidase regulatory-like domain-containing protein [Gemmatimonadaceae bacterium]|nr:carboxypeptidase regulatory-like domain-containing protein [Gemmatimonadaceae bacterium]